MSKLRWSDLPPTIEPTPIAEDVLESVAAALRFEV